MAMETVTNYTCDRCGRSELRDNATILTLTVRSRAGEHVPGQGKSEYTAHVCQDNCLKMIKAAMRPVGIPGRYDRKTAAARRNGTKSTATTTTTTRKRATKGSTKKAQPTASGKINASPVPASKSDPFNALPAHVRAVRVQTRTPQGGFAPGYNYRREQKMIKEAEARISADK